MSRMYLHQRLGDDVVEDREGAEFATVDDAVDAAVRRARAVLGETSPGDVAQAGWRFEIVNVRGELLAVVPVQAILGEDGAMTTDAPKWFRVDAI